MTANRLDVRSVFRETGARVCVCRFDFRQTCQESSLLRRTLFACVCVPLRAKQEIENAFEMQSNKN